MSFAVESCRVRPVSPSAHHVPSLSVYLLPFPKNSPHRHPFSLRCSCIGGPGHTPMRYLPFSDCASSVLSPQVRICRVPQVHTYMQYLFLIMRHPFVPQVHLAFGNGVSRMPPGGLLLSAAALRGAATRKADARGFSGGSGAMYADVPVIGALDTNR